MLKLMGIEYLNRIYLEWQKVLWRLHPPVGPDEALRVELLWPVRPLQRRSKRWALGCTNSPLQQGRNITQHSTHIFDHPITILID